MSYDAIYQKLRKQYTDKEIAESMMIPADLTEEEKKINDEELKNLRLERLASMTEAEKVYTDVVRLRFEMEDYIAIPNYEDQRNFGYFLSEYLRAVRKSQKDLAQDLNIHASTLNRVINNKELPNLELIYRLEKHSGNLIAAVLWWKLTIKDQEQEIVANEVKRSIEGHKVKNALSFPE